MADQKSIQTSEKQLVELEAAIAALEAQRELLGEAVVEASIAALEKQRGELLAQQEPRQQRKFATILMMDIAGHTQMIRDLDPEENMALIDAALMELAGPIEAHGGRVTRFTGDGFKAIFGHPVARENEPEMAVRAALAVLQSSKSLGDPSPDPTGAPDFQVRLGLDTGLVFVGGQSEGEDTVKGAPVNMAARLEAAAPPGGVLISHNTFLQVRGIFTVEAQEPLAVKGFDQPVQTYLVRREKPGHRHLPTRGVEGVETRMVGRESEFQTLQNELDQAVSAGSSRMVTVIGEAGVGKSRLLHEFETRSREIQEDLRLFKGRAVPETQKTPYALLRSLLTNLFAIQDGDTTNSMQRKFESGYYQLAGEETEDLMPAHFIARLAGFDFKNSPFLQGVAEDNQQLRDRAQSYLVDFFRAASRSCPALILLEDIHWADEYSLASIHELMVSLSDRPLLIVANARPSLLERLPQWGQGARRSRLKLSPLSRETSRELVAEILKKAPQVPLVLREMIVDGAEGNPFYIEELIKMLIEEGVVVKNEAGWEINTTGLVELDIPPTLTGVLQARLDSLPPLERMILQQASVVGRVFWDTILFQINSTTEGSRDQSEIGSALEALQGREMIFRRTKAAFSSTEEYFFKHSILRDVTYESVLKRMRPIYHRLVAEWLVEECGERSEEFNGIIGEHFERAGDKRQAVQFLHKAGEAAANQFANEEALQYLTRALDTLDWGDDHLRFNVLSAREQVHSLMGSRSAQKDDLTVMARLAENLSDPEMEAEFALRKARLASQQSDYPAIIEHARQAIDLVAGGRQPDTVARGRTLWGRALLAQGDYAQARARFESAHQIGQEHGLPLREADALLNLGIIHEKLDNVNTAEEAYQSALEIYRAVGDRRGEGRALNKIGNIRMLHGDTEDGLSYYENYLQICREIGDRWGEGMVIREMGDALLKQSDLQRAQEYYRQALDITQDIENRTIEGRALAGMGNVSLDQSQYEEAQALFERSLLLARNIGNHPLEGKILGLIGRFFHVQGDYIRARSYYHQALEILQSLGTRPGKSRQLTYLALLAHHLGGQEEARELAEQALAIGQELGRLEEQALAMTQLGHTHVALGDHEAAEAHYSDAQEVFERLGQANQSMEPLAGQAQSALQQGDAVRALQCVEAILEHLESRAPSESGEPDESPLSIPGLEGTLEPLRVYFTCYQVLRTAPDQRAEAILFELFQLVQMQAEKITDLEMRHSFLNRVAVNREISRAFERLKG